MHPRQTRPHQVRRHDPVQSPLGAPQNNREKTATVRNETDPSVASRAKLQAEQALDSGTANIHTSREAVDTDNATVLRVTTEDKTYSAVTFPLKGNGLSLTSNTTIVLSPDGAPATYSETHLTHNAANHFQMTSYTDGELVKDSDTGHEFVGDDVLQQQLDETRAAIAKQKSAPDQVVPVGAGAVAACLGTVLGIGGGAAWAITSLCGAHALALQPASEQPYAPHASAASQLLGQEQSQAP